MRNIIILFCVIFLNCFANQFYEPVAIDSRIKTFIYNPNEIYTLKFRIGYNSIIEFSKDESIETISLGDPYPWKLTPLGTRLFIKPIEPGTQTNMTVITNKRVYLFEIESDISANVESSEIVHVARFFYPVFNPENTKAHSAYLKESTTGLKQILQEKKATGVDNVNTNYSFSGSENITTPIEIFDDQKRTYIKFKQGLRLEGLKLFIFKAKNKKEQISFKRTGDFFIINGVYRNLLIEEGKNQTLVYNDEDI